MPEEITISGLSDTEAGDLLKKFGPNALPEKPPPSEFSIFVSQLKSPLVYILIISGVISAFTGEIADAVIIGVAVVINTFLGYLQEGRASKSLQALKRLVASTTEVIRDSQKQSIPTIELVPGDVVPLKQGLKIPADGVILSNNRLFVAEAIITGESVPIEKNDNDPVYMGTVISSGLGYMRVVVTGSHTKMGDIARQTEQVKKDTPMQKQLGNFSQKLLMVVLSLAAAVFVFGIAVGVALKDMFILAVAVSVSAIPEGLLVSLTVILAIGMQRILRRKGLVKNLASAETLGGVTVICTDKTGTLTEGKLQVVDSRGDPKVLALQILMSKDDPMVSAAREWAFSQISPNLASQYPLLDSIPFTPKEKIFSSLHQYDPTHHLILVNGAPENIIAWTNMSDIDKNNLNNQINLITATGNRVLGLARKVVSDKFIKLDLADVKSDLEWLGILVYSDPVRLGVKEVLEDAKKAGIRVILITGDYPQTAKYVLSELGISVADDQFLLGDQIKDLSLEELSIKLKNVRLLARTSPDQKLKIVQALKQAGEVVAMMGDGVNDAPALHESDIGIVVAEATDVARESADLVLLDSNFKTVLAAIEEGRSIFDNIRKVILYLLSDAFEEIVMIIGSIILKIPIPIAAMQILWINLFSDGFPNLALTAESKLPGIMLEYPRKKSESLVNRWMVTVIGLVSGIYGLVALFVYWWIMKTTGDVLLMQSAAFVIVGINSLFYVFSVRNLRTPIFKSKLFDNHWLNLSIVVGLLMQSMPFMFAASRQFFGLKIIPYYYWLIAIVMSLGGVAIIEVMKMSYHHSRKVILAE